MSLQTKTPLTEKILYALACAEPFFSRAPGAAAELFGFNQLRTIKRMQRYTKEREWRERRRVQKSLWHLEHAAFISTTKGKKGRYRLTPKGWFKFAKMYAQQLKREQHTQKKPAGKTYLIIFDIPEQHRQFRDTLRTILYTLGYTQLQRSVFAGQDIKAFEFIGRIVANCDLEDRVKLVIAEKVL